MSKSNKMFGHKYIVKKAVSYDDEAASLEPATQEESYKMLSKRVVTMIQVDDVLHKLLGELLTIADAVFDDSDRKKAVKDIIRKSVYDSLDSFRALSDDQNLA